MLIATFDIGGTSVKYGIINKDGEILMNNSFPTEASLGGESIVNKVIVKTMELKREWEIRGVSVSTAGQIDTENGIVLHATDNVPNYTGLEITRLISAATGLFVKTDNDVNCMAVGEHWKGAAKNVKNFLCITIGTGIGGALYLNGKLYTGVGFSAGEVGHISLYPNGKKCTCGNHGCFEQYASSSALEKTITEKLGDKIKLQDFFLTVQNGDSESLEIFEQWIDDLTTGLQSVIHMFNPEMVVIGGGVSAQGNLLLKPIKESLVKKVMSNHARNLKIKMAANGNKANLLGAAKNYIDYINE